MSNRTTVYVYIHTHWDREWYRTFQQYRTKLIEVIDKILDEFDKGELEYFTLDGQAIVIEDYLEVKPHNKIRLEKYIKEGRLDIGPWLVLPDEFLVSGESLIQNILLGHKISNKYGRTNKVGYIPDTFGHSIDIPLILNKFNIDNSVIWRGVNTEHTEFNWHSMDNSTVKVYHLLTGYSTELFEKEHNYSTEERIKLLKETCDKIKAKTTLDCILFPVGSDHRPPATNIGSLIKELNNAQSEYELVQCNLSTFLEKINSNLLEETLQQELRDCSQTYILPAVYSSRLYLKQENARLTNKINYLIEPFACYYNALKLDNYKLPDSEYLWKLLILNHPHDSICGCSIDEVHQEMEQRFKELHQACDSYINRIKTGLMKILPKGNLAVFNSSNYEYSGPIELTSFNKFDTSLTSQKIEDFNGHHFRYHSDINVILPGTINKNQTKQLLWADKIKPNSLEILKPAKIPNPVKIENGLLSNGLIELQVDNDSITIKDLQYKTELSGINQIIDRLDAGDSYNFGPIKEKIKAGAIITNQKIKETGPIRGILEITYEIDIPAKLKADRTGPVDMSIKHTINCNVIITANSKMVEFDLSWYNRSEDHILQVIFPTESDIYTTLVENHFCTFERRFDPHYNIYENIPAKKYTEVKVNTAPMQRFVQANEIALFTEGLPEYEIYKNNLYLTILRSTGYLSLENAITRNAYAGPEIAVPENQCIRLNHARYAVHPKCMITDLYKIAERFYGCIQCIEGDNQFNTDIKLEKSLIKWNNPNIISTLTRFNEETESITIHLLNTSSYPQNFNLESDFNIESLTEINLLNEPQNKSTENTRLIFTPHELKCFSIKLKQN